MPTNIKESGKIFIERTALASSSTNFAIKSAPKNKIKEEDAAMIRVICIERFKIRKTLFLSPMANSSAASRVIAVEIPLVAKVEAKT